MRLSETHGIVYVLKPGDHAAGVDGDSFKMVNFAHATFILQTATLTDNAVLTVKSGATAGAKTTSETFYYRLASADQAAASADVYAAETEATTLTLTAATYDNRTLILEVNASELTTDQEWLTLNISSDASAFNASCIAILSGPRYAEGATAIA